LSHGTKKNGTKFPKLQPVNAAAALAALNDVRAIPLLLELSSDKNLHWTIALAFHGLVERGVPIPGKEVADALEPFIAEHEKISGNSNDSFYAVVKCLAALLFSDTPSIGVDRIRRLPPERLKSYNVRDVLRLLGFCRAPEATRLLCELATSPEIKQRCFYELVTALSENMNQQARLGLLSLLDQLCSGEMPAGHNTVDPLAKAIARVARGDELIWTDIKSRCKKASSAKEREILSTILHEVGTSDAALALCDLIHDEFPIHYWMEQLVEAAATTKVPPVGSAYYLKPNAATDLRKHLMGIVQNDITRRASALEFLAVIAQCRLEHGYPANEPIHPDIEILKRNSTPWQLFV
jgi:NACHT C-terminal Alpha/Beta 2